MITAQRPIFWAKSIQGVFFVLMLLFVALNPQASLYLRVLGGVLGLLMIVSLVKQFRSPGLVRKSPTIAVVLLSLLFILIGGFAFVFEFVLSDMTFVDLSREPGSLIGLALLPVGLVTLFLCILDVVSNK
jgi:hypothetical protein